MAGDSLKESVDKTMSELRERLRLARENLSKVSRDQDRPKNKTAQEEEWPAEMPVSERQASGRSVRMHASPGTPGSAESLARLLRHQSTKLGSTLSGTEDQFLHIGARLHDFQLRARKISEISEYVARLINDDEIEKTVRELSWILDRLKTWFAGLPADDGSASRRRRAEKVLDRTESCLTTLTEKHGRSLVLARTFSERSDSVTRYVGEVVRALQYHDITRQRIEHVMAELDDLTARADPGPGKPPDIELAAESGDKCRELAGMLMTARDEFRHAALSIVRNLEMVASNSFSISEEIREATKGEGDAEKSFLSGMGNWISALADTIEGLSSYNEAGAEARAGLGLKYADVLDKEHKDGNDEFSRLIDILNGMVKSMHRVNGNVLYHLSLIEDSGKSLSGDIGKEIGMFAVHEKLASVLDDVMESLLSTAEKCGASRARSDSPHSPPVKHDEAQRRTAGENGAEVELF